MEITLLKLATYSLFLETNININQQDFLGNTILHYAILYNYQNLIDIIIKKYNFVKNNFINNFNENINTIDNRKNINVNIVNIDGLTIIHMILY